MAINPHPHPIIIPSITSPILWFAIATALAGSPPCTEPEPETEVCEPTGSSASLAAESVSVLAFVSGLEVAEARRQMRGR